MKLKFKHQKFQADAAKAVCDVFAGQPNYSPSYRIDIGSIDKSAQITMFTEDLIIGNKNSRVFLPDESILANMQKVQREQGLMPSSQLEGRYNLTIEMETGARVIIVTGCINILISRVSETFIENNSCIS